MKKLSLSFIFFVCFSAHASAQNFGSGVPISSQMSVTYPDSSTTFDPPPEVRQVLSDAKDAVAIYVYGRTSTSKASASDEALAFKRAASARAYLVSIGVSPLKIMVNYVSAADYVVDNSTPSGRATNQRVDIEMIFIE